MGRGSSRSWALALLAAGLPLVGFWLYGLFDLDEGFYAAVVDEMIRRGDWVTPHYNGSPWYEKPILLYWVSAPFVMLTHTELGARLAPVLATFAACALVGWYVGRRVSERAGWVSAVALGTSLLGAGAGRMMLTDPLLSLLVAGAFLLFFESRIGRMCLRPYVGALLGFTVLAKGPVALPIFVGLAVWTYLAEPDLRPAFRGGWFIGTLLFVIAVGLWYGPAYMAGGETFVQKFLVEQNLNRFAGGDSAHAAPLWSMPIYYPLVLLVGALPWSLDALRYRPRKAEGAPATLADRLRRYAWRWLLLWVVFFSLSGSKLPHYALPALPPLAILAGIGLARHRTWNGTLPTKAWVTSVVVCVLLNAGLFWYYGLGHREVHELAQRVATHPERVAAYQMPRREKSRGTGGTKLQETSHPSLVFYLGREFVEAETLDDLVKAKPPLWIITRAGRLGVEDDLRLRAKGYRLEPHGSNLYALYKLVPR